MRKRLFKWHSLLAIWLMLPVLIVSLTGSVLVFKVEIDSALRPHHMVVTPDASSQRLSIDQLMSTITEKHPDYVLSGWELFDDKARSDTAYVIKKHSDTWFKIYIDQYSGQILSAPQTMEHYITDWLLELHYAFLLHFNGTVIGALVGLVMLFLGISGIILYRKFWQKIFTLRWAAAKRILFSDVHKLIGIITSPIFILISFTGVYWNVSIILHEVIEHGFEPEHPAISAPYHNADISFEQLRQHNGKLINSFEATYLAIPNEPGMHITFFGDVDTSNPFLSQYASAITYDKDSGELISSYDIREQGVLAKFDDSTRKLHFGYFAGIWSKIVWCVVGLAPVLLSVSGLVMYLMRKSPTKRRRAYQQAVQQ
ncbi:PepSY-associated TM helix domain-containing protein [Glaciecola siphonariae]|uniref:PepSY-associated TM helix domain-containing protein n=1 Tax=Glaciecola siphonariae TaxID=521012 RepID=A0ABV9LWH7_9ALTE